MKTKKFLPLLTLFFFIITPLAFGMGGPPLPLPTQTPAIKATPTPTPTPSLDQINRGLNEFAISSEYSSVALEIGDLIDNYYPKYQELNRIRGNQLPHEVNNCPREMAGSEAFSEQITFFVQKHFALNRPLLENLAASYGVPAQLSKHQKVSFIGHPLCLVNRKSLEKTLKKVPDDRVIFLMNKFIDTHNGLRTLVLDGNLSARTDLLQHWSTFMGCLAYSESLTTANNESSQKVGKKYGPSDYRRPSGVKFYEDPQQPPASRLNIGLFQFTPDSGGNVYPCLRQWNSWFGNDCNIEITAGQSEMIRILGSTQQTFNAFCGVNKILQTFSIQINTNKTWATHPNNLHNDRLIDPADRCVTPFIYAGRAYNHFGPLQNSTGSNLENLLNCFFQKK